MSKQNLSEKTIASLRQEIDACDQQLLQLLNKRAQVALSIGKAKQDAGMPIHDPNREAAILAKIGQLNPGPLPQDAVQSIFQGVIRACRNLESPPVVAFLGPAGTFSHQAALQYFGPGIHIRPCRDLPDIVEAVARQEAQYGVLPIENSTEGIVGVSFDLISEYGLQIIGEYVLPVELHLAAPARASLKDIQTIYSHPQPLRQARKWLREHVPQAELVSVSSTAEAAAQTLKKEHAACVVGPVLLEIGGLIALAGPIEDEPDNRTRFWLVTKHNHKAPILTNGKTTLMLTLTHQPGSLAKTLQAFASENLNLTSIVSRPARNHAWEYRFFVDLAATTAQPEFLRAIKKLEEAGAHVFVLGSYLPADMSR